MKVMSGKQVTSSTGKTLQVYRNNMAFQGQPLGYISIFVWSDGWELVAESTGTLAEGVALAKTLEV